MPARRPHCTTVALNDHAPASLHFAIPLCRSTSQRQRHSVPCHAVTESHPAAPQLTAPRCAAALPRIPSPCRRRTLRRFAGAQTCGAKPLRTELCFAGATPLVGMRCLRPTVASHALATPHCAMPMRDPSEQSRCDDPPGNAPTSPDRSGLCRRRTPPDRAVPVPDGVAPCRCAPRVATLCRCDALQCLALPLKHIALPCR